MVLKTSCLRHDCAPFSHCAVYNTGYTDVRVVTEGFRKCRGKPGRRDEPILGTEESNDNTTSKTRLPYY